MNRIVAMLAALIALPLLSGCPNKTVDPVIKDSIYFEGIATGRPKIGVLATTAQRRMVIARAERDPKHPLDEKYPQIQFCAEPSPDAVDDLTSQVAASMSANLSKSELAALQANASYIRNLLTQATVMTQRSQGLQHFRDVSFTLCQMYLNGVIDEPQYLQLYSDAMANSAALIVAELPSLAESKAQVISKMEASEDLQQRLDEANGQIAKLREQLDKLKDSTKIE